MNDDPKTTITFNTVGITRSDGEPLREVKFSKCHQCRALVIDEDEDRQAHAEWHGTLRKEVGMAGSPFSPFGSIFGGPQI